jgi:WD40 repeat protein/tRNA A-37 threonylcarbamoyl transferase component Bud32
MSIPHEQPLAADRHSEMIRHARSQAAMVRERSEARRSTHTGDHELGFADFKTLSLPGFSIVREIHRGGQGVVFQALQSSTGRTVAVKVIRHGALASSADRMRFQREVEILGRLQHPNIVNIIDSGSVGLGVSFFVMDYIQGQPLDHFVRESHGLSITQCLELFARICDAVHEAHVRGVIHRDLKPGNVLVDPAGVIHILDFGLAKITAATAQSDAHDATMTCDGQFLGSLPWSSPEQANGDLTGMDLRSDVYSLGVMLFNLLTGKFPYEVTGSVRVVMDRISTASPVAPSSLVGSIKSDVDIIVLRCLQKEPARRYQSAGELARDLRHYLAGEPIEARRDSLVYLLRKQMRRYRMHLTTAAALLLILFASTAVALSLYYKQQIATSSARVAEKDARESQRQALANLYDALIAEARTVRLTGLMGQRTKALAALVKAAEIERAGKQSTLELRNEAISALALPEVIELPSPFGPCSGAVFDASLNLAALTNDDGTVNVVSVGDAHPRCIIPAPLSPIFNRSAIIHLQLTQGHYARLYDPIDQSRRLEVWRLSDAKLIVDIQDVPQLSRFDIAQDGRTLAVCRMDHSLRFYDLESGEETRRFDLGRNGGYLKFDPSGQWLARFHGPDEVATITNLTTEEVRQVFTGERISWALAWSPDGKLIAGADGVRVHIWDMATGAIHVSSQFNSQMRTMDRHSDKVVGLTFSPDSQMLCSASWDGTSILWDIHRRQPVIRLNSHVAWAADGRLFGMVSDGVHVYPVAYQMSPAKALNVMAGNSNYPGTIGSSSLEFDSTGRALIMGTEFESEGLHVFDLAMGREVAVMGGPPIFRLAVDSANSLLLTVQAQGISKWSMFSSGSTLRIGPPHLIFKAPASPTSNRVSLSANGRIAAIGFQDNGPDVHIINIEDGSSICTVHTNRGAGEYSLSPSGRWLAVGSWLGEGAEVFDARTGQLAASLPTKGSTWVLFSPDEQMLATTDSTEFGLWQIGTWTCKSRMAATSLSTMAFDNTSRIIAIAKGGNIRLIDTSTLVELATLQPQDSNPIRALRFSPNGSHLAAMTTFGNVANIWDLRSLRAELSSLNLDWHLPPYPPAPSMEGGLPLSVQIERGTANAPTPEI